MDKDDLLKRLEEFVGGRDAEQVPASEFLDGIPAGTDAAIDRIRSIYHDSMMDEVIEAVKMTQGHRHRKSSRESISGGEWETQPDPEQEPND